MWRISRGEFAKLHSAQLTALRYFNSFIAMSVNRFGFEVRHRIAMTPLNIFQSWGKVLVGKIPMLSIEVTRECPLHCPGCYAYGDSHLGQGGPNLRSVADFRDDNLVNGILGSSMSISPSR